MESSLIFKKYRVRSNYIMKAIWAIVVGALSAATFANEDALYGPIAPEGSTFIRILNASEVEQIDGAVASLLFPDVTRFSASEYQFTPAGDYDIKVGSIETSISMAKNEKYTLVVLSDSQYRLIKDANLRSKKKALISFYNLFGDEKLSLKTANGKVDVVQNVNKFERGERLINAVKLNLAVFAGNEKMIDADPIVLERGKVTSLFIINSEDKPILFWSEV